MRSLLIKLRGRLAAPWRRAFGPPRLNNVLHRSGPGWPRRALLSYLVDPFLALETSFHSNQWQNVELARLLDRFGYLVDVIHFNDERTVGGPYDLLLGLGKAAVRLAASPQVTGSKVYLATGAEGSFNNQQELQRIADVERRRNCRLVPRRLVQVHGGKLAGFDAIACFGNEFTAKTYAPFNPRVYPFNNTGLPGIKFPGKDFARSRTGFVYISTHGQIHKGLDLLLEVFAKQPDLNLFICGSVHRERDFMHCYSRELALPNIKMLGRVPVASSRFQEVCKQCASVVFPSCAEGQSGAVVDGMHAGLIPIISRECGIDTNDFGITLPDCSIETICDVVRNVATRPPRWHEEMSRKTHAAACQNYSREAFTERWSQILSEITGLPVLPN